MPTERIAMRRVREMLRLSRDVGLATREVGRRTGVAPSTLREMFRRFETSRADLAIAAGLGRRRPGSAALQRGRNQARPPPAGGTRLGGDKLFVDYAGDTVPVIIDPRTGKTRGAYIFVAVVDGSSLSFAHASWTETLPDWINAHARAFAYFGGAARLLVPDNPKVAVIKACFYDPQVNRTYAEMAAHYDTAVLPARLRLPRDKAKVEAAVRIVERWLLGGCAIGASTAWPRSTQPSPSCGSGSMISASCVTSAAPVVNCSRRSTPQG